MQRVIYDLQPAHCVVALENDQNSLLTLSSDPNVEQTGSFYIAQARVLVTQSYVIVAADDPTGPKVVFREEYQEFIKANESRIKTVSGKILAFQRDTTCGCGSRLKSWNPYNYLETLEN
jgi:hypothetical protein